MRYAKLVKDQGQRFIDLDPTGYAKIAWIPFSLIVDVSTYLFTMPQSRHFEKLTHS
jgi:hypothetical protein